jgi:hypothetical protein
VVILDVMDDMQRERRMTHESATTTPDDTRETTPAVLGQGRMLANPRRVRRA